MISQIADILPSYLQSIERFPAVFHHTGVVPQRTLHIEHHHIGLKPLLVAGREFLQILVPFVRGDH